MSIKNGMRYNIFLQSIEVFLKFAIITGNIEDKSIVYNILQMLI